MSKAEAQEIRQQVAVLAGAAATLATCIQRLTSMFDNPQVYLNAEQARDQLLDVASRFDEEESRS